MQGTKHRVSISRQAGKAGRHFGSALWRPGARGKAGELGRVERRPQAAAAERCRLCCTAQGGRRACRLVLGEERRALCQWQE